ncbi:MAG: double zinc ribbon domain-containing protein [Patescibacteria group bacterium]|nr:double zinc ribbon domain-containing protein [Patescibacteria group bacterium]MDW8279946.1 double zinc ribbon domain-containing protein [bacterium]
MKILEIFQNIIFPHRCPGCLKIIKNKTDFCKNCINQIKIYNNLFCPRCKNRILNINKICHPKEKFILGTATDYNKITEQAIHFLKFQFVTSVANSLSNILVNYFEQILKYYQINIKNFIVIPIPISKKRFNLRGFNQSELIAKNFCDHFNLKLYNKNLIKIKNNKPQSELKDINQRQINVLNCFQIQNPKEIINKNIILIDDIITTGSTIKEAVKILKLNKVKKIIALAVCKA